MIRTICFFVAHMQYCKDGHYKLGRWASYMRKIGNTWRAQNLLLQAFDLS